MTVWTASTQARTAGAADGDALGDGEALGDAEALGRGDALGEGDALGLADGVGDGDAEGDGETDALGLGDACVIVIVVTPFSVVAETRAPDAPRRNTPEIAPVLSWMKSAKSLSIMPG